MSPPLPYDLLCFIAHVALELADIATPTCQSSSPNYDCRVHWFLDIEAEDYFANEEDLDDLEEEDEGKPLGRLDKEKENLEEED